MKLIFATRNPGKYAEAEEIMRNVAEVMPPPESMGEVEETGSSLHENALIKARATVAALEKDMSSKSGSSKSGLSENQPSKETPVVVAADDTGLEVDALDGAPGVYSARYAGKNATYDENIDKLLEAMEGQTNRTARFRTVICLAFAGSDEEERFFEGIAEGRITETRPGKSEFGYSPIFAPDEGKGRTFQEMTIAERAAISHRGKAMRELHDYIKHFGAPGGT